MEMYTCKFISTAIVHRKEQKKPKQNLLDHWIKLLSHNSFHKVIRIQVFWLLLKGCFKTSLPFRRKHSKFPHLFMASFYQCVLLTALTFSLKAFRIFHPCPASTVFITINYNPIRVFWQAKYARLLSLRAFTAQCTAETHQMDLSFSREK